MVGSAVGLFRIVVLGCVAGGCGGFVSFSWIMYIKSL